MQVDFIRGKSCNSSYKYVYGEAGSRVGLAVKGATADEMKRGSLLCPATSATLTTIISLSFVHNRFYTERIKEGLFHVTVGMHTVPVNVTNVHNGSLTLESEKPLVYSPDDTFLLMNLNAKKLHIIGHGKAITSPLGIPSVFYPSKLNIY